MKRLLILTRTLIIVSLRQPTVLFWNMVFPVVLLTIYVLIFGGDAGTERSEYVRWIVPGMVTLNIVSYGLIGSSSFLVQTREAGVLRRVQATPVPTRVVFAAFVAMNVLVCLLQSALVFGVAALVFGWRSAPEGLLLSLGPMLMAIVVSVALGQFVASISPNMGLSLAISQTLFFAQLFTTGLVLPMDMLPDWIRTVGEWLPAYAIGDLVRSPLMDNQLSATAGRSAGLALIYLLLSGAVAARLFRWESRR